MPMPADEEEPRAELTTYSCKDAVIYLPIPAASTVGHRAEFWNVDRPLQDVTCSVVTSGDDCWVKLFDCKSGELFAECPLAKDKPLTTCVEPVVDSSRYFVLRVADRASGRHAFIGFGFRERADASDFIAALSDYQGYLRRAREAAAMQKAFAAVESGAQGEPHAPSQDLALKPGETLSLNLTAKAPSARGSFLSERLAALSMGPEQQGSSCDNNSGGPAPLLPPPPAFSGVSAHRTLSGAASGAGQRPAGAAPQGQAPGSSTAAGRPLGAQDDAAAPAGPPGEDGAEGTGDSRTGGAGVHAAGHDEDDEEFGGFVSVT